MQEMKHGRAPKAENNAAGVKSQWPYRSEAEDHFFVLKRWGCVLEDFVQFISLFLCEIIGVGEHKVRVLAHVCVDCYLHKNRD